MASTGRVTQACARCRRQKLKCDTVRPCTLCLHARVECQPRLVLPRAKASRVRPSQIRQNDTSDDIRRVHSAGTPAPQMRPDSILRYDSNSLEQSSPETQQFGANSSVMGFARNVFRDSNISSPDITSAIPGDAHTSLQLGSTWSLKGMEMPPAPLVLLLVEAYFDRVQWFICLFHEPSFLIRARSLLSNSTWTRRQMPEVIVILMAATFGLKCVLADSTWPGHSLLESSALDGQCLLTDMITETRLHLVDILEISQIETVQVCILLGTYYIYHGSPSLAWSILGLAVRTAYALALHSEGAEDEDETKAQVRRRCWNHITVADTFAAIIYGRPTGLDGAFANPHSLSELDDMSMPLIGSPHSVRTTFQDPPSKLTFHTLKYSIYSIIRQAISQLRLLHLSNPLSRDNVIALVAAVNNIESLLLSWRNEVPPWLWGENWQGVSTTGPYPAQLGFIAELGSQNARLLFQQALALQLTYDGAIILIRRPLLEYQVTAATLSSTDPQTQYVVLRSLEVAVEAAVRISRLPLAQFKGQLCLSFAFMHFFIAGVILCIHPARQPFTPLAQEAKARIKRIILTSREFEDSGRIAGHIDKLLTALLRKTVLREMDNALLSHNNSNADTPTPSSARPLRKDRQGPFANEQSSSSSMTLPLPQEPPDLSAAAALTLHSQQPYPETSSLGETANNDLFWYDEAGPGFYAQIDEAFGAFGQMMFNLMPNDPYNQWNWGSGNR